MQTVHDHIQIAKRISTVMDSQFKVLGIPVGLDPLFSIIPVFGSVFPFLLSFYLLWIGWQLKMPLTSLIQMTINIFVDYVLGSIPAVGVIADALFRSYRKNLTLIEDWVDTQNVGLKRVA